MAPEHQNIIILAFSAVFLGSFVGAWLVITPEAQKPKKLRWRALVRLGANTKTPVLCAGHAVELLRKPKKMALLDNSACEICNKKSHLME